MRAIHDSRDLEYREPFGAVPVGGTVRVAIDTFEEQPTEVALRLWSDTLGERLVEMESTPIEGGLRWECELTPEEPELCWYRFVLGMEDGSVHGYGTGEGRTGGEGVLWWEGDPPSFQLTVYRPRKVQPSWYTDGIVYQIFPDRFKRGKDWRERAEASLSRERKGPERRIVEDWNTPPRYIKDEKGAVSCWEFYGGTLSGVEKKLGYLADLGVTAIYLNPIFEAASCHRYDTADFLRIDPMLGDEESFRHLCEAAAEKGISIILDGVFNHVGQDSRYFNRYGNYPEPGAYQGEDSPYYPWFEFREDGSWASWWGVADLPSVNEDDPLYRKLICEGPDSVVAKWLRAGARGWRLDVADELPETLLRSIRTTALDTREDAVVIGEVWEDASNKRSYGEARHYFQGEELDGVMNYVLRDGILDFVLGETDAEDLVESITSLQENYPPEAFLCSLNLLGSHDRPRLMTLLGGAPAEDTLSDSERAAFRLSEGDRGLAKGRMWLSVLTLMSMPGVPCLYYGDEAGVEGYTDPYNRAPFPWDSADRDCTAIWRNAINLRKTVPALAHGSLRMEALGEDVLLICRETEEESVQVVLNRSLVHEHEVRVPALGSRVSDVVGGRELEIEGGYVSFRLSQLGSAVLRYPKTEPLGAELEHGSGIVCHISSLPSGKPGEPGTLGPEAFRFVDWLEKTHQRYWQILPLNPTDEYGSPYAGLSAFAGNTRLLKAGREPLSLANQFKMDRATEREYAQFCEKEASWLEPYAAFCAIKSEVGEIPWQVWPEKYRTFTPELLRSKELSGMMEIHRKAQFLFMREWAELRAYANEHGVKIIGDMPMYVSVDSSDVWSHRELFCLDEVGNASLLAGAPPDQFTEDGQLWGNPTYRWDLMEKDGYAWWMARLERAFELYDYVRLDHFLGFSAYYGIPQGHGAKEGTWRIGPGLDFFRAAYERFGKLPIVAEDLGTITPAVKALMDEGGFYGMDVIQFADADPRYSYVPPKGKIAYSSTHDTNTLLGWVRERFPESCEDGSAEELAAKLMDFVAGSRAEVAMYTLQDAIGLGADARMNVPGVAEGNWSWQTTWEQVEGATEYLADLTERAGRA